MKSNKELLDIAQQELLDQEETRRKDELKRQAKAINDFSKSLEQRKMKLIEELHYVSATVSDLFLLAVEQFSKDGNFDLFLANAFENSLEGIKEKEAFSRLLDSGGSFVLGISANASTGHTLAWDWKRSSPGYITLT